MIPYQNKTIYIADDSEIDRSILKAALVKFGYEVTAFSGGEDILKALSKANQPVVALLDWLMPDLSGVDVCQSIVSSPPTYPVYCIIVTSRTNKDDLAFALEQGADDFVTKPYAWGELRARIQVGIRLITSRQQAQDSNLQLLDYTRQMEELAASRAEQLVRADRLSTLGILSAGMAHEINNPASFVSVNIQTLEENLELFTNVLQAESTAEQRQQANSFLLSIPEILQEMKNGMARISKIVNGLKTYSHNTDGHHQYFQLEDTIESALQLCTNRLKYHITIHKHYNETPTVYGDSFQLEQVFVNLFTNAADAIEETIQNGTLTINTILNNDMVYAMVRDNGPGIPPTTLEKIFLPFYTTKTLGKGTGLGLSISRNILKDHKGELLVANHPSGGAQFVVQLPARPKDTP